MPLVDERGTLLGKVNLIDAIVGLGVLCFLVLGYGTYLLFRAPGPIITGVDPYKVVANQLWVDVEGQNLPAYLRATIGDEEAGARREDVQYYVETPEYAVVTSDVPDPGTYDLVLYDVAQEVARLPDAITVLPPAEAEPPPPPPPPPNAEVTVRGMFYPLDQAAALALVAKLNAPDSSDPEAWGNVLGVQPAQRMGSADYGVKAVVSLRCVLLDAADNVEAGPKGLQCRFDNVVIRPEQTIAIPLAESVVRFNIEEVLPAETTPVEILLRVVTRPEVAAVVQRASEAERVPALAEIRGTILSLEVVQEFTGTATLSERQAGRVSVALLRLRVPATESSMGWSHLEQPLKVGASYSFETGYYVLEGEILEMRVAPPPAPDAPPRP
jgi:hypothetical protein